LSVFYLIGTADAYFRLHVYKYRLLH